MNDRNERAPRLWSNDDCLALLAIEQTVLTFFARLDEDDAEGSALCFAHDGAWNHAGRTVTGREAIVAEMGSRPTGRRTDHLMTNLRMMRRSASEATITFSMLTYAAAVPERDGESAKLNHPIALDRYDCTLAAIDGIWLITYLTSDRRFALRERSNA